MPHSFLFCVYCRGDVGRGGEGAGVSGGMTTVECLRGRLLAERVASKAAKEEADQLATRVPRPHSSCVNSFNGWLLVRFVTE